LGWKCRHSKLQGVSLLSEFRSLILFLATQVLNAGRKAIMVSYIENMEDVYNLFGAVKYRLLKGNKLKNS
jgi:hypothetical protein